MLVAVLVSLTGEIALSNGFNGVLCLNNAVSLSIVELRWEKRHDLTELSFEALLLTQKKAPAIHAVTAITTTQTIPIVVHAVR